MSQVCVPVAAPLSRGGFHLSIVARRVRQRTVSWRRVGSYALHALDGRK